MARIIIRVSYHLPLPFVFSVLHLTPSSVFNLPPCMSSIPHNHVNLLPSDPPWTYKKMCYTPKQFTINCKQQNKGTIFFSRKKGAAARGSTFKIL